MYKCKCNFEFNFINFSNFIQLIFFLILGKKNCTPDNMTFIFSQNYHIGKKRHDKLGNKYFVILHKFNCIRFYFISKISIVILKLEIFLTTDFQNYE